MWRSFYEESILRDYNDLKNRLIKRNEQNKYCPVEITPLSRIYKHNTFRYKERINKSDWEKEHEHFFSNNTDGEWIFEYRATYEMNFFDTKEHYSPYYYEKYLEQELTNNFDKDWIGESYEDRPDDYVYDVNISPLPDDILEEIYITRLKYKKWLEKEDRSKLGIGIFEQEWEMVTPNSGHYLFQQDKESINVSNEEIKEYRNRLEKDHQNRIKEQQAIWQKAKDSWK